MWTLDPSIQLLEVVYQLRYLGGKRKNIITNTKERLVVVILHLHHRTHIIQLCNVGYDTRKPLEPQRSLGDRVFIILARMLREWATQDMHF